MKPPGYYVQRSNGLFPAPIPQDNRKLNKICTLFELLGLFVAKCIQDGRRVDIPLSDSFLKLMCNQAKQGGATDRQMNFKRSISIESDNDNNQECLVDGIELNQKGIVRLISEDNDSPRQTKQDNKSMALSRTETRQSSASTTSIGADSRGGASAKERLLLVDVDKTKTKCDFSKEESPRHRGNNEQQPLWFEHILDRDDLYAIDPHRRKFLQDLLTMIQERDTINNENNVSAQEKQDKIESLVLGQDNDRLEEMM